MKVFIAGNGSMGRRRERDLRALGLDATAYDAWPSRGLTPGQVAAFDEADVLVVSTPPKQHARAVFWASDRGIPCFAEADVDVVRSPHFPSATPLFTDWYASMRNDPRCRGTLAYTLHVGQHIDDWHPGADPETYYAYKDVTGPTREMIPFELIWLAKLYGSVTDAAGVRRRDYASILVTHDYGAVVGHILIDALSRPAIRRFTEVGDGWQHSTDLTYSEETYAREMRAFLAAVKGESPWPYSQAEEAANLEVLHMIEPSG